MAVTHTQVAANFIYTFYTDIQELIKAYSNYSNLIAYTRMKYGDISNTQSFEPQDTDNYNAIIQVLHFYNVKCFIAYKTMQKQLGQSKEIEDTYAKIKDDYVPSVDATGEFIYTINNYLMKDCIQDLLRSSVDIVNQMFGAEQNEQTKKE